MAVSASTNVGVGEVGDSVEFEEREALGDAGDCILGLAGDKNTELSEKTSKDGEDPVREILFEFSCRRSDSSTLLGVLLLLPIVATMGIPLL